MAQPKILLTRIDDRFIYGQDVELWNEAIGSNLVLIVNDEIAADSRQWAPMRVAAPEGVWTRFFSVQRTVDIIHTATSRQLIQIMVASPADALALIKGGVPITKIGIDLGLRNMMKLESKTIEIRWAQDVKQADGSTKTEGCKAFLRCVSKGIPGLSVDPGNTSENEATFAVSRYQLYVGGAEYWLIDQLNTILRVGGVDYAKDIRSLL